MSASRHGGESPTGWSPCGGVARRALQTTRWRELRGVLAAEAAYSGMLNRCVELVVDRGLVHHLASTTRCVLSADAAALDGLVWGAQTLRTCHDCAGGLSAGVERLARCVSLLRSHEELDTAEQLLCDPATRYSGAHRAELMWLSAAANQRWSRQYTSWVQKIGEELAQRLEGAEYEPHMRDAVRAAAQRGREPAADDGAWWVIAADSGTPRFNLTMMSVLVQSREVVAVPDVVARHPEVRGRGCTGPFSRRRADEVASVARDVRRANPDVAPGDAVVGASAVCADLADRAGRTGTLCRV